MSAKVWHCLSAGSCVAGFLAYAIPILQVAALLVTIITGIKAWRTKK